MAILVGVDEAGYGPLIGPLVITAAVFEVPDEVAGRSLWRLLSGAVSRRPPKRPGRVAIADSKRLYRGLSRDTLEHLERGVLAMLAAAGQWPRTLHDLLSILSPETLARMQGYPWYAGRSLPIPRTPAASGDAPARRRLQAAMRRRGLRLRELRSEIVLAREFNRGVQATDSKATVLFQAAGHLVTRVWRSLPAGRVRIHVDRLGARRNYVEGLPPMVEGTELTVLEERPRRSVYRVVDGSRRGILSFTVAAEDRQLPVALASMTSKYVRELFMTLMNRFWAELVPDLRPTAGYYGDGRRFFRQIGPALGHRGLDPSLVLRCR